MSTLELSAPYNWCDGHCHRCPLQSDCPVAQRQVEQAQLDPMEAVAINLGEALAMLEKTWLENGWSLDEVQPPPAAPPDVQLIVDTARRWYLALVALVESGLDVGGRDSIVYAKVCRLETHLCDPDRTDASGSFAFDAVPNLLLVEHLLAEVHAVVARARPTLPARVLGHFDTCDRTLGTLLLPLLQSILPEERAQLAALAAAGRAPSPFSQRGMVRAARAVS